MSWPCEPRAPALWAPLGPQWWPAGAVAARPLAAAMHWGHVAAPVAVVTTAGQPRHQDSETPPDGAIWCWNL